MESLYQWIEWLATFTEGLTALLVAVFIKRKDKDTKVMLLWTAALAVVYTVFVGLLNAWQTFSYLTIALAGLYIFICVKFLSGEKILTCLNTTVITLFFINTADALILYAVLMITGHSIDISKGVIFLTGPTPQRMLFLVVDKAVQLVAFLVFGKYFKRLKLLKNKEQYLILGLSFSALLVMLAINSLILTDVLSRIQIAAIFSLLFILLSLIVTIAVISINARLQREQQERSLMEVANRYMEKNYQELRTSQTIIRRQVHDFKNHIRTLRGLLNEDTSAVEYAEALLAESYALSNQCSSGNEIIDSIINTKAIEAQEKAIRFEFFVHLEETINLSSTDICAILANQIDNALEACAKIDAAAERFVKVEIFQKETFLFFKVTNSAKNDPFDIRHELVSSKPDSAGLHGFGIKIIKEIAARYNGLLKMEYKDGVFYSTVMITNRE